MSKKIVVLGAGLVGGAMAIDLAKEHEVTSVDINETALEGLSAKGITTIKVNIANENELLTIIKDYDLVVGAVPGFMGFETMRRVIKAGKNIVDIEDDDTTITRCHGCSRSCPEDEGFCWKFSSCRRWAGIHRPGAWLSQCF